MNNFWKVLTLFFLGAIFVAVLTHAKGFSQAAGSVFTGVQGLGTTLEAGTIKQGSLPVSSRFSGPTVGGNSDTGQFAYPSYGQITGVQYPLVVINGCEQRKKNRQPSQSDVDNSPWPLRRFTNISVTDVQLNNGLHNRVGAGKRTPYEGSGYLYAVRPRIPGVMRDNVAGFHKRGPSAYTVDDVFNAGPGSQPEHPGGPGKIAAPAFINPMSG